MQRRIEQLAGRLHGIGVRRGDRVAFLGLNQPMFLFTLFASAPWGNFVPVNFRFTGPEVTANVGDAEACVLIADAQHRSLIEWGARRSDADPPLPERTRDRSWQGIDDGQYIATSPVRVDADEVAVIMYTSGTTGRAKGARLTHGNFWWNNTNAMNNFHVLANDVTAARIVVLTLTP
jgi:fatty-acyl-CoA synthase